MLWSNEVELVRMWSKMVAVFSLTLVGLVINCKKPCEKMFSMYSVINLLFETSRTFKLKSPYKNTCSYLSPRSARRLDRISENWVNCCVKVKPREFSWTIDGTNYNFFTTRQAYFNKERFKNTFAKQGILVQDIK